MLIADRTRRHTRPFRYPLQAGFNRKHWSTEGLYLWYPILPSEGRITGVSHIYDYGPNRIHLAPAASGTLAWGEDKEGTYVEGTGAAANYFIATGVASRLAGLTLPCFICGWLYADDNSWGSLLTLADNTDQDQMLRLRNPFSTHMETAIKNSSNALDNGTSAGNDQWQCFGGRFGTGDVESYVDGVGTGSPTSHSLGMPTLNSVTLGADNNGGSPTNFLDGRLKEIRVYNRVPSDKEIAMISTPEFREIALDIYDWSWSTRSVFAVAAPAGGQSGTAGIVDVDYEALDASAANTVETSTAGQCDTDWDAHDATGANTVEQSTCSQALTDWTALDCTATVGLGTTAEQCDHDLEALDGTGANTVEESTAGQVLTDWTALDASGANTVEESTAGQAQVEYIPLDASGTVGIGSTALQADSDWNALDPSGANTVEGSTGTQALTDYEALDATGSIPTEGNTLTQAEVEYIPLDATAVSGQGSNAAQALTEYTALDAIAASDYTTGIKHAFVVPRTGRVFTVPKTGISYTVPK